MTWRYVQIWMLDHNWRDGHWASVCLVWDREFEGIVVRALEESGQKVRVYNGNQMDGGSHR